MPNISLIVCKSEYNQFIGFDQELLWDIKKDKARFRAITTGKPCIMGRKTYESIGKPLPERANIVLSKTDVLKNEKGIVVKKSISEAVEHCNIFWPGKEIMIIGGQRLYKEFMPFANKMYITSVFDVKRGDREFPLFSMNEWKITHDEICVDTEQFSNLKLADMPSYLIYAFREFERRN